MIAFVIRRLLFSVPVLLAASALIFFSVSALGDPLGQLRVNPLLSEQTVHNIERRNHLDDPIPHHPDSRLQDRQPGRGKRPRTRAGTAHGRAAKRDRDAPGAAADPHGQVSLTRTAARIRACVKV